MSPTPLVTALVALPILAAAAGAQTGAPATRPARPIPASATQAAAAGRAADRAADSAFAAVQARGADARAMGVDQSTSVHRFDALPDGGRIELQRGPEDSAGVAQVRRHLREIAAAFAAGDFRTPAFVHAREGSAPPVPGSAIMAFRRETIAYAYRDLPRGGEVRITTRDPAALRAVHAFVAFQRADHRADGAGDPHAGHAGHAGPAHAHPGP